MSIVVTTTNVNGIRAAVSVRNEHNPGLLAWLKESDSDHVLLQEIRATEDQARAALAPALDDGWHLVMADSTVKGHAGVGILSREPAIAHRVGFGSDEFDGTGRYLEADFTQPDGRGLTVASVYVPKGAADGEKYEEKFRFLGAFADHLGSLARKRRDVVIGGDWNIAPTERDLKNWKGNQKNPGFLPAERAWVADVLDTGWIDVVRQIEGDVSGPYSWWSWRGKAFDNDAGWRIDYQLANRSMAARGKESRVHRANAYDQRWSDHAPVSVTYE
ncbi:exodeoxyribonuclease III [Gordonia jinhuaensis]|uniref:Exodeoxyribonuclease n=1 Tax=Gordonia jinhuaensis TaxID=1517702 RepID=A0A916WMS0_9ACTN|nr:exodeoxyribonuclease III [Gordonia jinhuaensis]GGB17075.1 putative exodeoxyribonuclease [Gordonia jinhuaensis]